MFPMTKSNFTHQLRKVGLVVSNGKVSQEMVNFAYTNPTPYHKKSDNTAVTDLVGVVEQGQIVYQYNNSMKIGCMGGNTLDGQYGLDRDNATMKGLTTLNGQGDSNALSQYDFMNTIHVLGVVEMGNKMNCLNRFNIISGGILDVKNESNKVINNGDWLIAYNPTRAEVLCGGGKMRTDDEKNGIVHLWYKKYEPEIHRNQLKQIYQCLLDVNNTRDYLPAFRANCRQMMDSIAGLHMILFAKNLDEIKRVLTGPDASRITCDADLMAFILAKSGHSDFRLHPDYDQTKADEIRDAMFVPFSTNSKNAVEYLFPQDPDGATKQQKRLMRHLNGIQSKAAGGYIEATSYMVNEIKRLLVGQAKSTALPGDDFSFMVSLG